MNQDPAPAAHPPQTVTPPVTDHHTQRASVDYPSSPITTVKQGIKTFWQNGRAALAGVTIIGAVLAILAAILGIAAMASLFIVIFASWAKGDPESASSLLSIVTSQLPPELSQLAPAVTDTSGVALGVLAISGVGTIVVGTFLQALGYAYVGIAVIGGRAAHLGEIMRQAMRRTLPLLALTALCMVAVIVLLALPFVLIGQAPGAVVVLGLYIFVLTIALIVVGMRLAFAPLAIVVENAGPIQSLRQSWSMTKKRVWEMLGVMAVIMLATLVLELVFTPIRSAMPDSLTLLWALIEVALSTLVGVVGLAALAQRYVQFKYASSEHKVDYGINIGLLAAAFVAAFIVGSVQAAMRPTPNFENLNLDDTYNTEYLDRDGNPLFEDDSLPTSPDYNVEDVELNGGTYEYNYDDPNIYNYQ